MLDVSKTYVVKGSKKFKLVYNINYMSYKYKYLIV